MKNGKSDLAQLEAPTVYRRRLNGHRDPRRALRLETAREAKDLGAQEYCVKPIEKDELEEKVARVLGI